ncbi:LysR substrate-binding domain-containing protein [Pseudomonas sp. NPDC090233]|uniref:LysR substrate-binding domain-containing protein n=1 Tax=Pseudomonas sp. NPDC090233 TaxID=3364479 RepID=UPI00383A58E6
MRADTPLKAIACFDAVMRTGSATQAAQQLFVTPGAVGQQLRKLEDWLGAPLFVRSVRKLQPTAQAYLYWEQVKPALQQIDEASSALRDHGAWKVRVSLPPTLANTWFAKRMPALIKRFPQLQLDLSASTEAVDLEAGTFDLAVRHFDGKHADLDARLLLRDDARVYCSPDYQARLQIAEITDLPGATLLYTTSHANWSRWLAQVGMSFEGMSSGLRFDQAGMAIAAARRSQGLVLTSPWLVEEELEAGTLLQLFPDSLSTGKHYYLLRPRHRALSEAAQQFYTWLDEVACGPGSVG